MSICTHEHPSDKPIRVEGTTTIENTNGDGRSTHATERCAQIYAARRALEIAGWDVRGPASSEGYRRPLLLPGEHMMKPLDGSRSDERAQGLTACRGGAVLRVDACAGLPLQVLVATPGTTEAFAIVRHYLASAADTHLPYGTVRPTGRHTDHHVTGRRAPEYVGVTEPPSCSGIRRGAYALHSDYHERVTLPDGTVALVIDSGGEWGLFTHAVAHDAGGNLLGRRAATESMIGISADAHPREHVTVTGDGLVGWLI